MISPRPENCQILNSIPLNVSLVYNYVSSHQTVSSGVLNCPRSPTLGILLHTTSPPYHLRKSKLSCILKLPPTKETPCHSYCCRFKRHTTSSVLACLSHTKRFRTIFITYGNAKSSKPFIPTWPSTMKMIKDKIQQSGLKEVIASVSAKVGVLQAYAPGELPWGERQLMQNALLISKMMMLMNCLP